MIDAPDEGEEGNVGHGAAEAHTGIENGAEGGAEAEAILINGSVDAGEEVEVFPELGVHVTTVFTAVHQETAEEMQARLEAEWKDYKGEESFDLDKFFREHNAGA